MIQQPVASFCALKANLLNKLHSPVCVSVSSKMFKEVLFLLAELHLLHRVPQINGPSW